LLITGNAKWSLIMQHVKLLAGTALALVMSVVPVMAQQDEKSGGTKMQSEKSKEQGATEKGKDEKKAEPKGSGEQGTARTGSKDKEKNGKGAAQIESKEKETKGTTQTRDKDQDKKSGATEPRDKGEESTATPSKDQDRKGTAEGREKDQDKKGSVQAPKDRETKESTQKQPKEDGASKSAERPGTGERARLSEQQRTNVHQTIMKESNLNRATNINISVTVGTRIPRSVRLVALPASIISVVPAYRGYQYVVVDEQICIVDPNTYEIVEVISLPGQTARADGRGDQASLVLTEEEKAIVLESIEMDRGSTLALGTLTEGSAVPRDVRVRTFSDTVVQRVPKLKDHRYFTAENRVAVVDSQGSKVQLVIQGQR
jgi:Protein of unknown function (DUF1236)